MSGAGGLTVRRIRDDDVDQVLSLLQASLAGGPTGKRTEEYFRWKHEENPFGASPGMVATNGDTIVGVRLFMRWRFRTGKERVSAVRAVDTATHPGYQRRGIFKTLTLSLLDELETAHEVDLVFNTPNSESRPGYLKMGWTDVGAVPLRVGPGRPLKLARGLKRARAASASGSPKAVRDTSSPDGVTALDSPLELAVAAFPDEGALTDLLAQQPLDERLHTDMSARYLRWRYANAPGLDYRVIREEVGGELAGVAFGRLRRRADLVELTLGDVVHRPGDHRTARRLLSTARRSGVDHVTLHVPPGAEIGRAAWSAGFLPVPGGIRLTVNPRSQKARRVSTLEAWRLSLGDLEVF